MKTKPYKLKELVQVTGAKYYIITYLRSVGKLPLVRDGRGPGIPVLYHPDSVHVIKEHLARH